MKKLIPVILCCAMLLAACGSSADSAPAASESTSAAASSEAASSAESIIGGADGETDIVVSDEANTANLDAAVAAIEAVNPIANTRALDDFSVENELMLTMDNLVGYKGDVTNDQADCGLVFVAQAKDGKVDAVKAELEAYKESLSANDLYAEFADKVALADKVGTAAAYVSTGDCVAGFVYSSDIFRYDGIEEAFVCPEDSHKPIVYPGAVAESSEHADEAKAFIDFCLSNKKAQKIWAKYGFELSE